MQGFMITLLICSVTMSALALFYMAITPLLAKRYSVKGCYYAWLVIVIGLIIPFRPQFSNAIVKVDMPSNTAVPIIQVGNGTPVTVPAPVENALPSALSNISWWQITAAVWLAGMIIFLAYYVIKHYRFLKLAARWSENITDEQTLTVFQNLKTQMDLSQNIGLQFCDSIGSPMMIGFVSPRILLPKSDYAKDELRFILKHELVHYKRKDLWYKCLVLIATAIHWFNPIVYLMTKAIDIQCELSCDEKVVCSMGADMRQYYSETIISVVRRQSKLKTALSTNFYGGKKGMKKRIFSIMDMSRKKAGLAVLCGVLIFTLGTGFAFAANESPQNQNVNPPEIIEEDIVISPWNSFGFLPNPDIYAKYAVFGISISDDGTKLLYEGQPVRLFVDEKSEAEAFYLDEAGGTNLSVVRNAAGAITGIESITEQKAQEYQAAFFADEPGNVRAAQDSAPTGQNKYDQYQPFGITYSATAEALYFNGKRVKLFVDQYADGWFGAFWTDDAGTVNLAVIRDTSGQITSIESISDEKAQEYRIAADENEQNVSNGQDEKIAEKMKELYPES